jgi:c-di-GMP-binding flagellar brake protein YcgR
MWIFLLVIIFIFLVGGYLFLRRLGGGTFPWVHFYATGKESGFTFKEINLLRKIAVENKLQNPTSLFWSVKQLDSSIKGLILKFRALGVESEPRSQNLIAKLFEFRKRVELSQPKYKIGIKSSKHIVQHQRLRMILPGFDAFSTSVVENLNKYLALSYPRGPQLPPGFSWKGKKIGVHFWRLNDAGYFFQSKVIDDYINRKYPIIHIAHSDNLVRTQKRRSVRIECNIAAELYPMRVMNEADEHPEDSRGLRCKLVDLSEDGAAILIGGRAKLGLVIKLQFELAAKLIIMNGVVKGINFDQKRNRSILHMQAMQPSASMQNAILSYVYNIFGDRSGTTSVKPVVP